MALDKGDPTHRPQERCAVLGASRRSHRPRLQDVGRGGVAGIPDPVRRYRTLMCQAALAPRPPHVGRTYWRCIDAQDEWGTEGSNPVCEMPFFAVKITTPSPRATDPDTSFGTEDKCCQEVTCSRSNPLMPWHAECGESLPTNTKSGLFPQARFAYPTAHPPDLSTKAGGTSHRPLLFPCPPESGAFRNFSRSALDPHVA